MIDIIELERYISSAGISCIIIDKCSYWKELGPINLLKIEKSLEIDINCLVLSLSLAMVL